MNLQLGEIAAALDARCGLPEREVCGYCIDSRSIAPGQLFFAIRGPRFDGHQFVAQAMARGAAGAVVERQFFENAAPALATVLLPVPDTLQALQQLARQVRRRWGRPLVAVTGSTGKSSTKEMIAALLGRCFRVHKSAGNLNNHYGLPLTLLAVQPEHEVAVVELAMSAPGEIARLASLAEPETGVVTNVAPVHLEFFDSLEMVAQAKRELIENLVSGSGPPTAVLNQDDARVRGFADGFKGDVFTFGFEPGADFRAIEVQPGDGIGSRFRVAGANLDALFSLPIPGRHNVQNALAAIVVAARFQVPSGEMQQGLAEFRNLAQRGEIVTLPGPVTIINDCYNSNPLAMARMLETLGAWPRAHRRIVIAGEMLELGPHSPQLHYDTGRLCAANQVSWLLAVQGNASFFLEGAVAAGLPPEQTRFFQDSRPAGEFCRSLLEPGDVVLIKGSRGVHLEVVTEILGRADLRFKAAARPNGEEKPQTWESRSALL